MWVYRTDLSRKIGSCNKITNLQPYKVPYPTMKRPDQGYLHPKLEVPGLTCPGPESNPGLNGERRAI